MNNINNMNIYTGMLNHIINYYLLLKLSLLTKNLVANDLKCSIRGP